MPVTLTEPHEIEAWLAAPWPEVCKLQSPLPDEALVVVARGQKTDGPADGLAGLQPRAKLEALTLL